MIDMTHNRDHRWTRFQRFFRINIGIGIDFNVGLRHALDIVAELLDQQFGGILVDRLVDGNHRAHVEQGFDQIGPLFAHTLGQLLNGNGFRHDDRADLLFARFAWPSRTLGAFFLFAGAFQRSQRTSPGRAVFAAQCLVDSKLARLAAIGAILAPDLLLFLLRLGPFRRFHGCEFAGRRPRIGFRRSGLLADRFGHGRCLGSGFFRRGDIFLRLACLLFFGLAVFFSPLLLFRGLLFLLQRITLARFLHGLEAGFFCLAQQFCL